MSRRVRIGTCANPPDAALVRSMFAARGIHVVVGAEHHASLLGPLGASFLSLDIWVDADDAEEAAALLRDFRDRDGDDALDDIEHDGTEDDAEREADPGDLGNPAAPDDAEDSDAAMATGHAVAMPGDSMRLQLARRRQTAIVVLLGCFVTFGTAHIFTRAWMRGIALAGLEGLGLRYAIAGSRLGGLLIAAAIVYDVIGALWRVHAGAGSRSAFPVARVHNLRDVIRHDALIDRTDRDTGPPP